MQADYVIVGAGPAAVAAAETLRKNDAEKSILMVDGEAGAPYSRMAIPYVLTGQIDEAGTALRSQQNHYDDLGVTMIHARVSKVDGKAKQLTFEDGKTCKFEKLLIATGASPVNPPIKGLDLDGVHHCWTLEDARAIAGRATKGSKVVLIGAGFIGCIILEALIAKGASLTVVEAEDRMVPAMMNETAGGMIKSWCESKGIAVLTSTRVDGVEQKGEGLNVSLNNGSSLDADLLVVATGVKANIGFLDGSGIETDEGIKVNHCLRTNVADVYAAGDCAQAPDFSTGGWSGQAIQPTATEHGHIAALNMSGNEAAYNGSLLMNVLDTVGLISASFGDWQGVEGGDSVEVVDKDHYRYTLLNFDGDVLIGAMMLGRTTNIGVVRGLIQTRAKLGIWKDRLKEDPNLLAQAYIASLT